MSTVDLFSTQAAIDHRAPRKEARTVDLIVFAWRLVMHWSDRARQRRMLAELDDRLLSDAGISRAQAIAESKKPFWQ